jgi:hypothetical protein
LRGLDEKDKVLSRWGTGTWLLIAGFTSDWGRIQTFKISQHPSGLLKALSWLELTPFTPSAQQKRPFWGVFRFYIGISSNL